GFCFTRTGGLRAAAAVPGLAAGGLAFCVEVAPGLAGGLADAPGAGCAEALGTGWAALARQPQPQQSAAEAPSNRPGSRRGGRIRLIGAAISMARAHGSTPSRTTARNPPGSRSRWSAPGRSTIIGRHDPGLLTRHRSTRNRHPLPGLKLTSDTLAAHLEKQLLPAYLISGDEPLLALEAADAVRARARAAGFTERETHFMDRGADWNDVRASASNLSLFAERRIVELRLPSGKPGKDGGAALIALLEARDPDRLLLITAPRLDRDAQGADWVRAVEAHGAWVQIWPVDAPKLVG